MQRFLLALILLEIPLQADVYLLHHDEIATWGTIGGLNISITTICLAALYLLWIPNFAAQAGFPDRKRLRFSWPAILYVGAVALSLLPAHNRLLTLFELWLLLQAFLIYLYVASNLRTREDLLFVMFFLVLGLALQGMFMLAAYLVGDDIYWGFLKIAMDDDNGRIAGTLGSVILAASYFSVLIPATMGLLVVPGRLTVKTLVAGALALALMGLVLTQSRGGWLAAAVSSGGVLWCVWKRGWLPSKTILAMGVVGVVSLVAFQGVILDRLTRDDQGSAYSRVPLYQIAMEIIRDHPLAGVGANNCATVALAYATQPDYRAEWFYTVHNKYLLTWLETGPLGLIAYVVFLLHTIYLSWRTWLRHDRLLSVIGLCFGAALAGQMVHMSVDVFNSRPQVQMMWLVAGVVTAIYWMRDES